MLFLLVSHIIQHLLDLLARAKTKVQAFNEGGVKCLLAVRAATEHTRLPVICTFTFDKTQQGDYRTMMGVSPEQTAAATLAAGADVIGINCGNSMARKVDYTSRFCGLKECVYHRRMAR